MTELTEAIGHAIAPTLRGRAETRAAPFKFSIATPMTVFVRRRLEAAL